MVRNYSDSKDFYIGLISGLVVSILALSLEYFDKLWNINNNPDFKYRIGVFVLMFLLVWALYKWRKVRDIIDKKRRKQK